MDYLSHLYLPGALALWCAVLFSLADDVGLLPGPARRRPRSLPSPAAPTASSPCRSSLASVVLSLLLMMRDFRIEYVYQYSGMDLPAHFQFAAFWAGPEGELPDLAASGARCSASWCGGRPDPASRP